VSLNRDVPQAAHSCTYVQAQEGQSDVLRFLTFRLDFNHFYNHQSTAEQDASA
jgi:hypothetical protein